MTYLVLFMAGAFVVGLLPSRLARWQPFLLLLLASCVTLIYFISSRGR